ncbi:MAG TPA: adenylate/guanylate cyclase domain-containing protein, partial [Magnetospirillaceae bacterium]|nr:adenylate/guanylate cyclase domain-containing protein [Magnetospirillaceae bacterium]
QLFSDNAVDGEVLVDLTEEDLAGLGIVLGHRKKILKAIDQLKTAEAPPAAPERHEAERRLLTVMFCDLVGSTELSSRMDAEDMRELLRHYQKACTSVVAAYDGFVAQYLGDGIMVYFGYPRAREDAAERAVHAALDIVEAVRGLREDTPLQVRIGITTGTAVVGDVVGQGSLAQLHAASGQTPNLAARIHSMAEPQQILIGDATKRRVGGLFDYEDLGDFRLKGIPEPVHVWRVLAESKGASRFDAVRAQNLAPLVGRRDETELLDRLWREAREQGGRAVLLSGEAGIGKSRLVEALRQRLRDEAHAELRWQCSPRHTNSPLHPFVEQLALAADLSSQQGDAAKVNRLMALLSRTGQHETLDLPLLVHLLSIPTTGLMSLSGLTPARQRAQTIEALVRYIGGGIAGQPALLVFEDVHWIDPSSLDALTRCIAALADWPVLLVMTARPEFIAPWGEAERVTVLRSGRIAPEEAKALIGGVTGYRELPTEVEEMIIRKADGNPLFIEELTKLVLESGLLREEEGEFLLTGSLASLSVPETLQDSLMERLDRWPALKEVAQIGSVIGGEFSYRMISAVSDISERILQGSLQQLSSTDIILGQGVMPETDFIFKHALMQDAAYSSLLRSKRQKLHKRVSETLLNLFPDIVTAAPQVMAHHLMEAGSWLEAISYFHQAGMRLMQRSANVEAVRHLSDGIALLAKLPEGAERTNWEFKLNLALGQASFVIHGPAAKETTEAFAVAQRLLETVGDAAQRYDVLYGIFGGYILSCRLDLAAGPAERVLDMATRSDDPGYRCLANRMLGVLAVHKGDFPLGRSYLDQASRRYDPELHRPLAFRYGGDIHVIAQLYLAGMECFEDKREEAFVRADAALAEAHAMNHALSIGQAYAYCCYARFYFGDREGALDLADVGLAFCSKTNVTVFAFIFRIVTAWGKNEDSPTIRRMMAGYADAGGVIGLPLFSTMLAEVLLARGETEAATLEMRHALASVRRTGELFFEPLTLLVLGECLLAEARLDEARACLEEVLVCAGRMGAALFERRAREALSSLIRDGGPCHELSRGS